MTAPSLPSATQPAWALRPVGRPLPTIWPVNRRRPSNSSASLVRRHNTPSPPEYSKQTASSAGEGVPSLWGSLILYIPRFQPVLGVHSGSAVELRVSLHFPNKLLPRRAHCLSRISLGVRLPPVCHLFCLSAMHTPCHPVLHGFEGSAWARSLRVPHLDLRPLCGSIDGPGGESRNVHPIFCVKT